LRHYLQDLLATAAQTARQTIGIHQRPVSVDTVRGRLAVNNLARRRSAKGHILTTRHRQERLQWATDRRNWRHQQWWNIIFSDENRYCILTGGGRTRVWRRRGEPYSDYCVIERDSWVGQRSWYGVALDCLENLNQLFFKILVQVGAMV
jgi:hypothetical protein